MRKLFSILTVLSLITLSLPSIAFAQDSDTGSTVFLPMVSQGEEADSEVDMEEEGITAVSGAISPQKTFTVDKATVSAASGGNPEALHPVSLIVTFDQSVSAEQLQAVTGGQIIHRYKAVFNGVSLVTMSDKVDALAGLSGVTGIYLDELQQLDTETSPDFIDADDVWDELGGEEKAGEGVIVGILDSGIWPEHPSVSDPDPEGDAYPAPPIVPGANGFGASGPRSTCDFGNTAYNVNDVPFTCNNKLIGAYSFIDTYKAFAGLLPTEFDSARDDNGHGTHTATTAAGNGEVEATLLGVDRGEVSGVAPRAHIIAYRVCGEQGCYSSDSVAAVEQAILDGVDVINFSISGGGDPYNDIVEQAFLVAYENGVFVAASAGNAGPGPDTVDHRGPWVTTVAASTSDRHFLGTLTLQADNGDTLDLIGATVTSGISTPTPVVFSPDPLCNEMPAGTFNGEIVVCDRGVIARVLKSYNVAQAGASGMILRNPAVQDINTDNHSIPSIHINGPEGTQLEAFTSTHTGVTATFTGGVATEVEGDVMAAFSSRGGPGQQLGISKPDVTAPGVQILAGHTPLPATAEGGQPGQLFQSIQGTSMSSPHVAGAAALLKDLHPDWTPGQIKSALMTSGETDDVKKEDGETDANAFDRGSGRIDLDEASHPGLTIDESAANYLALETALWKANYPSLFHPGLPGIFTVQRTVKDVTGASATWKIETDTDHSDWNIIVPSELAVTANGEATFEITVDASRVAVGQVRFGEIKLKHGDIRLYIPVSFVRGQAVVALGKSCTPATIRKNKAPTECTITLENTSFEPATVSLVDDIPAGLALVDGSVVGADVVDADTIAFNGVLAGAAPPLVTVATNSLASPFGYVPLSTPDFGSTPIGAGDETIANFTVPDFLYAGETYDTIGIVSNGYIVVGGGTGADVNFINSDLPDAAQPNNVLAPFWTDLNPADGGQEWINILTDGVSDWLVVEWEAVPNWSNPTQLNTFQVWIGLNGVEDISFVYGPAITGGDGGFLTVGAENKFGSSGGTVYFNGVGEAPSPSYPTVEPGYEVEVTSVPGAPGGSQTITFQLTGTEKGKWQNCATLTSDLFEETSVSCARIKVK